VAVGLGVLVLGESFKIASAVGLLLIFVGSWLATGRRRLRSKAKPRTSAALECGARPESGSLAYTTRQSPSVPAVTSTGTGSPPESKTDDPKQHKDHSDYPQYVESETRCSKDKGQ
jgi:hypothetical protein